jgi:hypothetical protein
VEASLKDQIALEREIGVDESKVSDIRGIDEAGRSVDVSDELEVLGRLRRVIPTGAQAHARVRSLSDGRCRRREQNEQNRGGQHVRHRCSPPALKQRNESHVESRGMVVMVVTTDRI